MPTLTLADRSLHYLDVGEGEAVLFLHAFPFHSGMWKEQAEALSSSWRILAPDARGLGQSLPAPDALTMEMIADDAVAVLDALGIARAAVVGLSMGGYAALAMWQRHRDRIAALALCDTRTSADDEQGRAGRHGFASQVLEAGSAWAADQLVPVLLRQPPPADVEATVRAIIGECSPAGIAAAQRGMARREDSGGLLAGIDVPTLVLCGAEDRLTPPSISRAMAEQVPGARYAEVPGAGHLANLEAPETFNSELAELLGEVFKASTE